MAASAATFSFGAHSAYISSYVAACSKISVLGVPGYAEANVTPASYKPRAIASLPDITLFIFIPSFAVRCTGSLGSPSTRIYAISVPTVRACKPVHSGSTAFFYVKLLLQYFYIKEPASYYFYCRRSL